MVVLPVGLTVAPPLEPLLLPASFVWCALPALHPPVLMAHELLTFMLPELVLPEPVLFDCVAVPF
jgi:hypothetical protein